MGRKHQPTQMVAEFEECRAGHQQAMGRPGDWGPGDEPTQEGFFEEETSAGTWRRKWCQPALRELGEALCHLLISAGCTCRVAASLFREWGKICKEGTSP